MNALLRLSAIALVAMAATAAHAAEWDSFEAAQKESARTGKPMFLSVMMSVQGYPDTGFQKFRDKSDSIEDAKGFIKASVNVGMLNMKDAMGGGAGYTANPEMVAIYGSSGSSSVWAPGATAPLWMLDGGTYKEDVFTQAKKAWDTWKAALDELEARIRENKDLKKDADTLLEMASVYQEGRVPKPALENLDEAVKLVKKADKADARLEELALQRADIQLDCRQYAEAKKAYTEFQKNYKAGGFVPDARLGAARAMIGLGEKEAALKELRLLKADATATKVHKQADSLISSLEKELEKK